MFHVLKGYFTVTCMMDLRVSDGLANLYHIPHFWSSLFCWDAYSFTRISSLGTFICYMTRCSGDLMILENKDYKLGQWHICCSIVGGLLQCRAPYMLFNYHFRLRKMEFVTFRELKSKPLNLLLITNSGGLVFLPSEPTLCCM